MGMMYEASPCPIAPWKLDSSAGKLGRRAALSTYGASIIKLRIKRRDPIPTFTSDPLSWRAGAQRKVA